MTDEPFYLDRSPPGFEEAIDILSDTMAQLSYAEEYALHKCLEQYVTKSHPALPCCSHYPLTKQSQALLCRITHLPFEMQRSICDFIAADLTAQQQQQSR